MSAPIAIGTHVVVKIERSLSTGLVVLLPGGGSGLIRLREFSWTQTDPRILRKMFRIGDLVEAVAIRVDESPIELSLRLAQYDPWDKIAERFDTTAITKGKVTRVLDDRVYIELMPGVEGALAREEFPVWSDSPEVSDAFWRGDAVCVYIKSIDWTRRQIILSMANIDKARWAEVVATKPFSKEGGAATHSAVDSSAEQPLEHLPLPLDLITRYQPRKILLVDDTETFLNLASRTLKNAGHQVVAVGSSREALEIVDQDTPELVISDLSLPEVDGIALIKLLSQQYPTLPCVLMTDWVTAQERSDEIESLEAQGVKFLLRPVLPDELVEVSFFQMQIKGVDHEAKKSQQELEANTFDKFANRRTQQKMRRKQRVAQRAVLAELSELTRASKVILFSVDLEKRKVAIHEHVGQTKLNTNSIAKLIHSPVRDAAEESRLVSIYDARESTDYIRNLMPLLDFRSCVGTFVDSIGSMSYALFVFSRQPGLGGSVIERETRLAATALSSLLRQVSLLQSVSGMQRVSLLGNLTRSLVHETNHSLGHVLLNVLDLQSECNRIKMALSRGNDIESEVHYVGEIVDQLSAEVNDLARITRSFGQLPSQDRIEMLNLSDIVQQCVDMVYDAAVRCRVKINFNYPDSVMAVQGHANEVRQVILNLLLNSIQQISLARPQIGGRVEVNLLSIRQYEQVLTKLTVEDDGPGIHSVLYDRIFQLGITSREDGGTGLGLYIARQIVEQYGGQIYVESSARLWGTCMAVELPIHLASHVEVQPSIPASH